MGKRKGHHQDRAEAAGAELRADPAGIERTGVGLPAVRSSSTLPLSVGVPTELEVLGVASVWRCVTLIADAIAGRDWAEWRGAERLAPSRIVRRPCAFLTRREWTWRVVATLALYNTAHCLMVGGVDSEGVPGSLIPLRPDMVAPAGPVDPWGLLPPARFHVGSSVVSAEQLVIMRRAPLPTTPAYLATILALARRTFAAAIAGDRYAVSWWLEGGAPTVVLSTDQELTTAQADAIADRWTARHTASKRPAVLGKGAKAEPFGADPTAEAAVAARRELVADVARLFGVPPHLVNAPVTASMTYTTTEAQALDLIRYTLRGYSDPVEDAISELLPGDYIGGRRVRIDFGALTVGEQRTRYGAWHLAIADGWMSRTEVRIAEGLPPELLTGALEDERAANAPPAPPTDDQEPAEQPADQEPAPTAGATEGVPA